MTKSPQFLNRAAAATYIRATYGIRCSKRHLANLASNGSGPAFHKANRDALYETSLLDIWAQQKLGPALETAAEHREIAAIMHGHAA